MKTTIEWVSGSTPEHEGYHLVTVENRIGVRSIMPGWWHDGKNQWEECEFTLLELGLTVVAYAELPEPWGGENKC